MSLRRKELITQKLQLRGKIKKVLSRAYVCSLEQRARDAHDQNEQTLHWGDQYIQSGSKHVRRTLEFPMRTAMHGTSRVSSAISVCDNQQNFITSFSTVAVAQWVRRWSSGHRVVQADGSSPGGDIYQIIFQQ